LEQAQGWRQVEGKEEADGRARQQGQKQETEGACTINSEAIGGRTIK